MDISSTACMWLLVGQLWSCTPLKLFLHLCNTCIYIIYFNHLSTLFRLHTPCKRSLHLYTFSYKFCPLLGYFNTKTQIITQRAENKDEDIRQLQYKQVAEAHTGHKEKLHHQVFIQTMVAWC